MLALAPSARADQAILSRDDTVDVPVGGWVELTAGALVLGHSGIPTVVYDGGREFGDDETVVATITLHTSDDLGTVEILSLGTLTGVTPSHWTADPIDATSGEFTFDPPIVFRYTAPSHEKLGCADRPDKVVVSWLHVAATLIGSSGAKASFSADTFPGTVGFDNICPVEESSAPHDAAQGPAATALAPYVNPHPGTPGRSPTPVPSLPASAAPSPTSVAIATETTPSATAAAVDVIEPIASDPPASAPTGTGGLTRAAVPPAIAAFVAVSVGLMVIRRRRATRRA
jgi:hypothetical protein